jgi:hypothetical protein
MKNLSPTYKTRMISLALRLIPTILLMLLVLSYKKTQIYPTTTRKMMTTFFLHSTTS